MTIFVDCSVKPLRLCFNQTHTYFVQICVKCDRVFEIVCAIWSAINTVYSYTQGEYRTISIPGAD